MNLFRNLFNSSKTKCPRCLGKGHVDQNDIIRLKKEIYWMPGSCAYCHGTGKIKDELIEKLPIDFAYLTADLSANEIKKLMNTENAAMQRAVEFEKEVKEIANEIIRLYFIENMESQEIAEFIIERNKVINPSENVITELRQYIEKIIAYKLRNTK